MSDVQIAVVDDGLLTVEAAARFLSVGRTTLYAAMDAGQLVYCKIGRARRIPRRALVEFAAASLVGGWARNDECCAASQPVPTVRLMEGKSQNVATAKDSRANVQGDFKR